MFGAVAFFFYARVYLPRNNALQAAGINRRERIVSDLVGCCFRT